MPNRKNKKSQAQMKLLVKAQNEKKTLLPAPSQESPPTAPCQQPAPRRQPPQSRRQQPPPPPPPAPPARQQTPPPLPPPPKEVRWQPLSSTSPKASSQELPQQAPTISSTPYQANRDWRVLRNCFHPQGTTIEMMYTGEECLPQAEDSEEQQSQQQPPMRGKTKPSRLPRVEARPGITHAKVQLPPGVLPTTNCLPDMHSYINAIDFFAHPKRHQPDPNAGPRTTVTVTPKAQTQSQGSQQQPQRKVTASSTMEVVPLGAYQAPPLEPGALNMAFQTFSTMDFRLETPAADEATDPNCTSYNAEISPTMMLTSHQQHRLQTAVLQEEVPLVDALVPIVQDIRKEYAQMRQPSAMHPLPYATMQLFSKQPNMPQTSSSSSSPPQQQQQQQQQAPRAGGFGAWPGSVPVSVPGFGSGSPRMVLMPTPQMVPIRPNFANPPPRYPVFVRPNFNPFCGQPSSFNPNYGQPPPPPPQRYPMFVRPNFNPNYGQQTPTVPPPPRYPGYVLPNYNPNFVQPPPRYPVFLQPRIVPRYGMQPPRYPVFVHPNYIPNYVQPATRPFFNGRTSSSQM